MSNKNLNQSAADVEVDETDWVADPSEGAMVFNGDINKFYREVDENGWDGVKERLTKEGHGDSTNGYFYV